MRYLILLLIPFVAQAGYIKRSKCGVLESVEYSRLKYCQATPGECVHKPHKSSEVCQVLEVEGIVMTLAPVDKKSAYDLARDNERKAIRDAHNARKAIIDDKDNADLRTLINAVIELEGLDKLKVKQ